MSNFNQAKIQANFNKAAANYDHCASLQKLVVENFAQLIKTEIGQEINQAKNIIDLGSGTGFISKNLSLKPIINLDIAYNMLAQNPAKSSVNADIKSLPFKQQTFDIALSSLAFQWLDLNLAIDEIYKTLKPNGILAFSIIGEGSLGELKKSAQKTEINLSINDFISQKKLQKILAENSLEYSIKSETIILKYNDAFDLMKSIKSIGAGYSSKNNNLTKKDFWEINSFYLKNFNCDNKVICTWQVFYVISRFKKESNV